MKRTAAIHSFRARHSDSRRNKINMSSNLPMIYDRSVCSKVGEGCPLVITQLLIIETPVYVRLPRINLGLRDFAPAINVQAYLSMEITFLPRIFFFSFSLFVSHALSLSLSLSFSLFCSVPHLSAFFYRVSICLQLRSRGKRQIAPTYRCKHQHFFLNIFG